MAAVLCFSSEFQPVSIVLHFHINASYYNHQKFRKREVKGQTPGIQCFLLEVAHVKAAHSLLARASHMIMINYKKVEKCNLPKCRDGKRTRSWKIYVSFSSDGSTIILFILQIMKPALREIKNTRLWPFSWRAALWLSWSLGISAFVGVFPP